MTVRSACSARRRFSSSAFLLAAAAALTLPLLAIDAEDGADCALSFTDLPMLSNNRRLRVVSRATIDPTRTRAPDRRQLKSEPGNLALDQKRGRDGARV